MKSKILIFFFVALDFALVLYLFVHGNNVPLLAPNGAIGIAERNLLLTVLLIMLCIVIPAIFFVFFFAWKYKEGNSKSYEPELPDNITVEILKWVVPIIVVCFIALIIWKGTHALDPGRPIDSANKPIVIQVVALRWKWLFIYPEQNIATVNYIQFPQNTPVNFELTADAPMSSFWIPSLGGQIYAMTGMSTGLNLIANKAGEFEGSAAEINGDGFSGMKFVAKASSKSDFDNWVKSIKNTNKTLDLAEYNRLANPSENDKPAFYSSSESDLYNKIMMKFMVPSSMDMKSNMNMDMNQK